MDFCRTYLGVDPAVQPIPVQPTAHYAMGGIPTDIYGRVIVDESNRVLPGLYAVGECACVSVHGCKPFGNQFSCGPGAVFGKHAGLHAAGYARDADLVPLPPQPESFALQQLASLRAGDGAEQAARIGKELRSLMFDHVGVFRTAEGLRQVVGALEDLRERYHHIRVQDTGTTFNQELQSAWELGNLLDLAYITAVAAEARTESRGTCPRGFFPPG